MVCIHSDGNLFPMGRDPERFLFLRVERVGKLNLYEVRILAFIQLGFGMLKPIRSVHSNVSDEIAADFVKNVQVDRHGDY